MNDVSYVRDKITQLHRVCGKLLALWVLANLCMLSAAHAVQE
jgi:hypothetical protein